MLSFTRLPNGPLTTTTNQLYQILLLPTQNCFTSPSSFKNCQPTREAAHLKRRVFRSHSPPVSMNTYSFIYIYIYLHQYQQRSSANSCQASIIFSKFLFDSGPPAGREFVIKQAEGVGGGDSGAYREITWLVCARPLICVCACVPPALVIIRQGRGRASRYRFLSPSLSPALTSAFALQHPTSADVNRGGKVAAVPSLGMNAVVRRCAVKLGVFALTKKKEKSMLPDFSRRNRWLSGVVVTNYITDTWQGWWTHLSSDD